MNKVSITIGILAASVTMSAIAGPNWQIIRRGESQKNALLATNQVLPLDHGPRALSTPWLNKEYKLRILNEARKASGQPAARTIQANYQP